MSIRCWNLPYRFAAVACGLLLWAATANAADQPLTVCLEEDSPPLSYKFGKKIGGFDFDVAKELAARLGREFKVQWYEAENDEENVPRFEMNALLSSGLCQLIGGFPMLESMIGPAAVETFSLPDYEGKKRSERGKVVRLGTVTTSIPYNRAVFAAIVGPKFNGNIKSLDDLAGRRIMAEVATIPGALLMRHNNGALVNDTAHISPLKNIFKAMDSGTADVMLIELHRFERYKFRNPDTTLRFSGYTERLGFNLGFAALDSSKDLVAKINRELQNMTSDGTFARIANANSMTHVKPEKPDVMGRLRLP